jgi:hypothetical protein
MHLRSVQTVLVALLLQACASVSQFSPKSVDVLDPRSGVTLGVMPEPLAFIETGVFHGKAPGKAVPDKQPGIVYLGPVERDRSGQFTYGLWVQVVPGEGGHLLDDIRARGAVSLKLDDGLVTLAPVDLPEIEGSPYPDEPFVSQAAYFAVDVPTLKRMEDTQKIVLSLRTPFLTTVDFIPKHETHTALQQYLHDRGIAGD